MDKQLNFEGQFYNTTSAKDTLHISDYRVYQRLVKSMGPKPIRDLGEVEMTTLKIIIRDKMMRVPKWPT